MADDLAWAAGLFEGEGFLTERPTGRRIYLSLGIEMRDLDVLEHFVTVLRSHGVTPLTRASGPRQASAIRLRPRNAGNPKHSDVYVWTTSGHTAEHAFNLLRPYLGQRRTATGDAILARAHARAEELRKPRNCKVCSAPFTVVDYGHSKQFCSKLCYHRWKIEQPGQREAARERNRRYKARARAIR